MPDDLDRFADEIVSNLQSLIVTCRQLRNEVAAERRMRADAEARLEAFRDAARLHTQGPLADRPRGWDKLVDLLAAYDATVKGV